MRAPIGFHTVVLCTVLFSAGLSPRVAAETAGADLNAAFDAIENPTITAEVDPPSTLRVGRAEIRPGAGTRLFLFSVGGREAGYVLDGPAELVYRVEDRFSVPAARHNLKRADGIDVRSAKGTLTATTRLKGAAVWGWDMDLTYGEKRAAAGAELPGWLRPVLEKKFSVNPARNLLCAERNGDRGYRWALFHAPGEDFFLHVDPRSSVQTETLYRLLKSKPGNPGPLAGRRFTERLATQPIGRPWWQAETQDFASSQTEIEVRNEKGEHVEVVTRTRLQTLRDGMQLLPMLLMSGTVKDERWHDYTVTNLTVDGRPAPYVHRNHNLLVALPKKASAGESFLLEVRAEGEVLERPSGDNYWRLGFETWYPKPGIGGEEWAEIRVAVEVREPFLPFTGGEIVKSGNGDGMNRVETRLPAPMRSANVLAGKYRTTTEELDGQRVHISSYATVKEEATRRVGQVVLGVMECLGNWLGVPYPFQDLQVIEVQEWGWGQAPPGVIFITQEAFLTRATAKLDAETELTASLVSRGINERVAHEVAHAWFPHVAKVVRSEENWLSESFSDYTSAVCLERKMADKKKAKQLFNRQLREWKTRSKEAGDATSIYLANHLAGHGNDWRTRIYLLYGRGPLVLHAIRQELKRKHGEEKGDQMFFTWIRSYVANFTFKVGDTPSLIAILNQISGEDWQPFFERHVYGVEPPKVD